MGHNAFASLTLGNRASPMHQIRRPYENVTAFRQKSFCSKIQALGLLRDSVYVLADLRVRVGI